MIKETMTPRERVRAAVKLEPYDRVPVIPIIGQFAARQAGLAQAGRDGNRMSAVEALRKNFDDLGGYDGKIVAGVTWPISTWRANAPKGRRVLPGQDGVPDNFSVQYDERYLPLSVDLELANRGWEHPQQASDTAKRRRCHHVPGAGTPDTVVRLRHATLLHP